MAWALLSEITFVFRNTGIVRSRGTLSTKIPKRFGIYPEMERLVGLRLFSSDARKPTGIPKKYA
jgi:hypothetical protein